jgi:hypothetical protein
MVGCCAAQAACASHDAHCWTLGGTSADISVQDAAYLHTACTASSSGPTVLQHCSALHRRCQTENTDECYNAHITGGDTARAWCSRNVTCQEACFFTADLMPAAGTACRTP